MINKLKAIILVWIFIHTVIFILTGVNLFYEDYLIEKEIPNIELNDISDKEIPTINWDDLPDKTVQKKRIIVLNEFYPFTTTDIRSYDLSELLIYILFSFTIVGIAKYWTKK